MTALDAIATTDADRCTWAQGWAGTEAKPTETGQIERLFELLDKPWFCRRHNVLFTLSQAGSERLIEITKGGKLAATWSAQGPALVFQPTGTGASERAGTLDCAISITCDFLDHARIKPPAASARNGRLVSAAA